MKSTNEMLLNDHSGIGLKALKEELFEMEQELKKNMDKGLSSEEMTLAKAYHSAIDAIKDSLEEVYDKINNK